MNEPKLITLLFVWNIYSSISLSPVRKNYMQFLSTAKKVGEIKKVNEPYHIIAENLLILALGYNN